MPRRNPYRLYIHIAFTYSVGPSSVVWSELGPAPPFPPMRVLEVQWSRALSLECEVALSAESDVFSSRYAWTLVNTCLSINYLLFVCYSLQEYWRTSYNMIKRNVMLTPLAKCIILWFRVWLWLGWNFEHMKLGYWGNLQAREKIFGLKSTWNELQCPIFPRIWLSILQDEGSLIV